jgi:hypothetical protein
MAGRFSETVMRRFLLASALLSILSIPPAMAAKGMPAITVTCPGGLVLHAEQGSPTTLNGEHIGLSRSGSTYTARRDGTTITLTLNGDGTVNASYTNAKGAHGICAAGS